MNRITNNPPRSASSSDKEPAKAASAGQAPRSSRRGSGWISLPESPSRPTPQLAWRNSSPRNQKPQTDNSVIESLRNLVDLLSRILDSMNKPAPKPAPKPEPREAPGTIPGRRDIPNTLPELGIDSRRREAVKALVGMSPQDAEAQARREGITDIRVISRGGLVTLDYRPQRLNLSVNDSGQVAHVDWG